MDTTTQPTGVADPARAAAQAVLRDPVAQRLMHSHIPARLSYVALDGTPRVLPMSFHWTGDTVVMCTVLGAPKVRALQANPAVALTVDTDVQPPNVLMVRGLATLEEVDGPPPEFLAGSRKLIQDRDWDAFLAEARVLHTRMVRITIVPTWAKVLDFVERMPDAVARVVERRELPRQEWYHRNTDREPPVGA